MNVHELPMILFTVIAQMCVGTFIILGLIQLAASRRHDRQTVERLTEPVVYVIGPAMVLGLALSMLHMNDITNTFNVFRNLNSSWLSREIVFGIAFAALGFLFALMQWFKIATIRTRQLIAATTALAGIGLIWSMSQIYYSLTTVPAWNTPIVPFHFFATTLMLGALATGCALMLTHTIRHRRHTTDTDTGTDSTGGSAGSNGTDSGSTGKGGALATAVRTRITQINAPTTTPEWTLTTRTIQWLALTSAAIGILVLISYPLHITDLATQGTTTAIYSGAFFTTRLILLGISTVLLALFTYKTADQAIQTNPHLLTTLLTTAFTLALITELMGRSLHYDSMTRIGI